MDNNYGHWILINEDLKNDQKNAFGFVYLIVNKTNNRKYIGSKQLIKKITKKPLKGKKQKRHSVVESDWKTYTGSCNELNKDIELLGEHNFEFIILEWAYSKMDLKYKELKEQILKNAIYSKDYYNRIVNVRLTFAGEKY